MAPTGVKAIQIQENLGVDMERGMLQVCHESRSCGHFPSRDTPLDHCPSDCSTLSRMFVFTQPALFTPSCLTCWLCHSKRHIPSKSKKLPANTYLITEEHTQTSSKMTSSCGRLYERRESEALCTMTELTPLFCRFS